jgi:hypothetical protein
MRSEDERVAAVACNSIVDRAFGKPKIEGEGIDSLERCAQPIQQPPNGGPLWKPGPSQPRLRSRRSPPKRARGRPGPLEHPQTGHRTGWRRLRCPGDAPAWGWWAVRGRTRSRCRATATLATVIAKYCSYILARPDPDGGACRSARQGFRLLVRARTLCHADLLIEVATE